MRVQNIDSLVNARKGHFLATIANVGCESITLEVWIVANKFWEDETTTEVSECLTFKCNFKTSPLEKHNEQEVTVHLGCGLVIGWWLCGNLGVMVLVGVTKMSACPNIEEDCQQRARHRSNCGKSWWTMMGNEGHPRGVHSLIYFAYKCVRDLFIGGGRGLFTLQKGL